MNKSNRDYHRALTTNSYNQDFIYYKYNKQPSKSPKFKNSTNHNQSTSNHSQIQSLKNTLDTMFDPISKSISKSFNKSVAHYPNHQKMEIPKNSKSVYEEVNKDVQLNNKLEMLTSKLRQIAEKPHFNPIEIIPKKEKSHQIQHSRLQQKVSNQLYLKNTNLINEAHYLVKQASRISNKSGLYSQQFPRSKSKNSFDQKKNEFNYSNSQSSSLKRQSKQLKNDKSISVFHYRPHQTSNEFEHSSRPRGKIMMTLMNQDIDNESAKIKINSYLQKKQKKSIPFSTPIPEMKSPSLPANVIKILQPHRGPINSIVINSDGKRFLTASNDYSVKESTLDGRYNALRKHQGRVNVIRMIDDSCYTGGNDCKIKFQKGSFLFQSPVLEIYPHEKQCINVGTSSTVQLYNVNKRVSLSKIQVKTKFYKLFQKLNKNIYFTDNHNLSVIDWRVPYPLINLYQDDKYISDWISDPYSNDFYHRIDNSIIYTNFSRQSSANHSVHKQLTFDQEIKDYCWKKDKVYFLTQRRLQVFQHKKNGWNQKLSLSLSYNFCDYSKLQIKNDLWICGTKSGQLIVNTFS